MSAYQFQVIVNGKPKRLDSAASTVDFSSIKIGASLLEILEDSGNFAFSNKKLVNVANPTAAQDAATKNYVDLQIASLGTSAEWQDSVLDKDLLTPPGSPANGDRYLIGLDTSAEDATGAWAGHDGKIAEWNGSEWVFSAPTTGTFVSADDENNSIFYFGGITWVQKYFEATTASGGLEKIGFDVSVKLEGSNATLEVLGGGELAVKLSASGAIEKKADGLGLKLEASNPSLQIASNELGLKMDPAGALSKVAAGVKVNVGNGIEINANNVQAKSGDSSIKVDSAGIKADFTEDFTNDNASAITVRQAVYVKADGDVDLAQANGSFGLGTKFGLVAAASIDAAADGEIYVRPGAKVPGFVGLTVGEPVYLSRSAAGGYQQDLTGFVAGEHVVQLGYPISATELLFDPKYLFEY